VQKEGWKWVQRLCNIERGLGDCGFDGLETFKLFSTPDNRNKLYSAMSSFRIIIEQIIGDIKDYSIPTSCNKITHKKEILEIHHKLWTIGAGFVNNLKEESTKGFQGLEGGKEIFEGSKKASEMPMKDEQCCERHEPAKKKGSQA
jgi:hypothetical protein